MQFSFEIGDVEITDQALHYKFEKWKLFEKGESDREKKKRISDGYTIKYYLFGQLVLFLLVDTVDVQRFVFLGLD